MGHKSPPSKAPAGRLFGDARVSTSGQDLSRQLRALKAERCVEIFSDTASGKSRAGRPELEKVLAKLAPRDVLVLAEWDHYTRSMRDRLRIVREVIEAGATIMVAGLSKLRPIEARRPRLHCDVFRDG